MQHLGRMWDDKRAGLGSGREALCPTPQNLSMLGDLAKEKVAYELSLVR